MALDTRQWLHQAREAGLSDMEIQQHLKNSGWTDKQINEMLVEKYTGTMAEEQQLPNVGSQGNKILPGIGELLRYSWKLISERFGSFLVLVVITFGFSVTFVRIVATVGGIDAVSAAVGLGADFSFKTAILPLLGVLLFMVVTAVILSWVQAAFIFTAHSAHQPLGKIISRSVALLLPVCWVNILCFFFVFGAGMLFVFPGIIFAVSFSFAANIFVSDGVSGFQALRKSRECVRGYWWAILGRIFALWIIIGVPLWGLSLLFAALRFPAIGGFIVGALALLSVPLAICYHHVLYRALRSIKGSSLVIPKKKTGLLVTAIAGWSLLPVVIMILVAILTNLSSTEVDAAKQLQIYNLQRAVIRYQEKYERYPTTLSEVTEFYQTSDLSNFSYSLSNGGKSFKVCTVLNTHSSSDSNEYCLTGNYKTLY